MIIHISGAPGSGKSTLGKWIKNNYENVYVKDIDNLYHEFIASKEKSNETLELIKKNFVKYFQNYIDRYIDNHNDKDIVFVGLNYPDPRIEFRGDEIFVKEHFYNLHSDYNFYIDPPVYQHLKQKFKRTLKEILDDFDNVFDDILHDNIFKINFKEWIKENNEWKELYLEHQYKMMNKEKIIQALNKLL